MRTGSVGRLIPGGRLLWSHSGSVTEGTLNGLTLRKSTEQLLWTDSSDAPSGTWKEKGKIGGGEGEGTQLEPLEGESKTSSSPHLL